MRARIRVPAPFVAPRERLLPHLPDKADIESSRTIAAVEEDGNSKLALDALIAREPVSESAGWAEDPRSQRSLISPPAL